MQARLVDDPPPLTFVDVPAVAEALTPIRRALADWATLAGLPPRDVDDLVLASYEAMANVVDHAYYLGQHGRFRLDAACTADLQILVTVSDTGQWAAPPTNSSSHRGRGLPLIHQLAHRAEVHHDDQGTTVRMCWGLPS
ncbi:MAG: ATP-binding protein [Actinomycetota bacterium]|nr:ATP-binding protein [Actinomycetota bacterium]